MDDFAWFYKSKSVCVRKGTNSRGFEYREFSCCVKLSLDKIKIKDVLLVFTIHIIIDIYYIHAY